MLAQRASKFRHLTLGSSLVMGELEQRGVFYFHASDEYDEKLLKIFQYGMWDEQNPEFLASLSSELKTKLRQVSLISMAVDAKSINYATLTKRLGLDFKDVELFIVEAVLDKAVDGRIDADQQLFHIYSCASRNVNPGQVDAARVELNGFLTRLESLVYSNIARLGVGDLAEHKA